MRSPVCTTNEYMYSMFICTKRHNTQHISKHNVNKFLTPFYLAYVLFNEFVHLLIRFVYRNNLLIFNEMDNISPLFFHSCLCLMPIRSVSTAVECFRYHKHLNCNENVNEMRNWRNIEEVWRRIFRLWRSEEPKKREKYLIVYV